MPLVLYAVFTLSYYECIPNYKIGVHFGVNFIENNFQREGDDVRLLSLDETISEWLDANKAVLEPNNTSCSLGVIVNGISTDLGFDKHLEGYMNTYSRFLFVR